jgi:hypothetical protein
MGGRSVIVENEESHSFHCNKGKENSGTMSVAARYGDEEKVKEDLNVIGEYVKNDLYYRAVFLWDDSVLDEGTILHKDFLNNCKPKVANGQLMTEPNAEADAYLKFLWTRMQKDNLYRHWMGLKRSNAYQAVMEKFMSE